MQTRGAKRKAEALASSTSKGKPPDARRISSVATPSRFRSQRTCVEARGGLSTLGRMRSWRLGRMPRCPGPRNFLMLRDEVADNRLSRVLCSLLWV